MTRRTLVLTSAFTLFFLPTAVFAQDPTSTAQRLRSVLEEQIVNATARKEEIKKDLESRTEEFHQSWSSIESEEKRTILAAIEDLLERINSNRTEYYSLVLTRLREILEKVQSRTERAKEEGADVSIVGEAIKTSVSAISIAEKAVIAQKEKVYPIHITDESTAKNDAGEAAKTLQTDLKATRESVVLARKTVIDAFLALKEQIGEDQQ